MTVPIHSEGSSGKGQPPRVLALRAMPNRWRFPLLICLVATSVGLTALFPALAAPIATGATVMALAPVVLARRAPDEPRRRPDEG